MKKKYFVTDEETGKKYSVEEDACKDEDPDKKDPDNKVKDDDEVAGLTAEEIAVVRELIPFKDQILALVKPADQPAADADPEEDPMADEDPSQENDVVDTDPEEMKKAHDSKKSFGAIQKKASVKVEDAFDKEERIAKAWANR